MRTIIIVVVLVACAFGGSIGFVWYHMNEQKPVVILERLRRDQGDRAELLMRLQVARGR